MPIWLGRMVYTRSTILTGLTKQPVIPSMVAGMQLLQKLPGQMERINVPHVMVQTVKRPTVWQKHPLIGNLKIC